MTASPTPPDFFAESAKNPDHIGDANKMVSAGLPSEEEIEAEIRPMSYKGADLTECVSRILDLIRPAFEAKERDGVGNSDGIGSPLNACCYRDECRAFLDRALSAEAKLAQAVEARAKLDQRIHNQRVALRENWQIVEMRRRWLGSDTARIGYLNARRLAKGWRERALDAEATIQVLEARAAARGEKT